MLLRDYQETTTRNTIGPVMPFVTTVADICSPSSAVYAEESTVARFAISAQASVHDLKQQACSELANMAQ